MRPYVLVLIALVIGAARAEEAGSALAVQVSAADCAALVPGAAYVPGIDQTGNPVAPADLPPAPQAVTPDTISVEIDPKLADRFGVPAKGLGPYGTRPVLGYVTVAGGKAYFNGKPLAPDAADAVAAACAAARK